MHSEKVFAIPEEHDLQQMPIATLSLDEERQMNNNMPLTSANQMLSGRISVGYHVEPEAQKLNEASSPQQEQYGQNYFDNRL